VAETDGMVTGEGDAHKEALRRAVLALSQERHAPASPWPTGQAHL